MSVIDERDQDVRGLDEPRDLTSAERALIDRLLEVTFPGRDALRVQLNRVQVTAEGRPGTRTRFA